VLPSAEAGVAGTGIAFADETAEDVVAALDAGDDFSAQFVRFTQDGTTIDLGLETGTIALEEDGEGNTFAIVSFPESQLEELEFNYGQEGILSGRLTLANGQDVDIFEFLGADYARIVGVNTFAEDGVSDPLNLEGAFIVGLETDPDDLLTEGTATYAVDFEGYGVLDIDNGTTIVNEVFLEGVGIVEVDFAAATVGATLDGGVVADELDGELDGETGPSDDDFIDFTGTLEPVAISGNSFSGDLAVACSGGATCTSDSVIGGAFFGPNAEEVAGLVAVDIVVEDPTLAGTTRFVAGAGFASEVTE